MPLLTLRYASIGLASAVALEDLDLLDVMHDRREVVFGEQRHVLGLEKTLQQQDGLLYALQPQARASSKSSIA